MSETTQYDIGSPTIELRIYDDGRLIGSELCESEDDAAAAVDQWTDLGDVTFVVDDLTNRHGPDDVLAPELALGVDEEHPTAAAPVAQRGEH